jgi:hypothetical protein
LKGAKEANAYRYAIHALACGRTPGEGQPISSKSLTNPQISRVFDILRRLEMESWAEVSESEADVDPSLQERLELTRAILRMTEFMLWLSRPDLEERTPRQAEAEAYLQALSLDLNGKAEWGNLPVTLDGDRRSPEDKAAFPACARQHKDLRNLARTVKARLRSAITLARETRGRIERTAYTNRGPEPIDHIIDRVIRYGPWQPYPLGAGVDTTSNPELVNA